MVQDHFILSSIVFLLALIVAFWILIFVFVLLKPGRPLWLKGAPGLSIVPGKDGTISFHPSIQTEINSIADNIDKFLDKLEPSSKSKDIFKECNKDRTWGYNMQVPCVFIKLNKVYGFTPDTYEYESELPDKYPSELIDLMNRYPGPGKIFLTCKPTGSFPIINYIPFPYFDATTDMKGINRVVALQLTDMPTNKEISVTCKAWAKNIPIDMDYRGKGHAEFSMNMQVKT